MADGPPASAQSTLSAVIAGMAFGYPEGSGATARAHAYARGLTEAGARVHVVSLLTPDSSPTGMNDAASGTYDGVSFEYACGTRLRRSSFLGRRLLEARVPVGLWRASRRHFSKAPGPRAIIAYSDQAFWITLTALVARSLRAKCVVEVCEVPLISEQHGARLAVRRWLLDAVAYKLVDGFIVISGFLEEYMRQRVSRGGLIVRVPILVSPYEFGVSRPALPSGAPRQIVYLGGLGNEGEVADLLDAFTRLAASYPDVILKVVGDGTNSVRDHLTARVAQLDLCGRVDFAGWTRRDDLPRVLRAATMLVLPRREGLFSQAGFPTKLGEYLASGRPVVTTVTGEIARHLTHGETAYLVPPGDSRALAEQMRHVLEHADEAEVVGANGRALACRRFDRRRHGARLCEFLCALDRA